MERMVIEGVRKESCSLKRSLSLLLLDFLKTDHGVLGIPRSEDLAFEYY